MVKCSFCDSDAEALIWDNRIFPVCRKCLDRWLSIEGEANTTFFMLHEGDLPGHELDSLIDTVNSYIRTLGKKYERLLRIYSKIKEVIEAYE